jgi:hypothetical protein
VVGGQRFLEYGGINVVVINFEALPSKFWMLEPQKAAVRTFQGAGFYLIRRAVWRRVVVALPCERGMMASTASSCSVD